MRPTGSEEEQNTYNGPFVVEEKHILVYFWGPLLLNNWTSASETSPWNGSFFTPTHEMFVRSDRSCQPVGRVRKSVLSSPKCFSDGIIWEGRMEFDWDTVIGGGMFHALVFNAFKVQIHETMMIQSFSPQKQSRKRGSLSAATQSCCTVSMLVLMFPTTSLVGCGSDLVFQFAGWGMLIWENPSWQRSIPDHQLSNQNYREENTTQSTFTHQCIRLFEEAFCLRFHLCERHLSTQLGDGKRQDQILFLKSWDSGITNAGYNQIVKLWVTNSYDPVIFWCRATLQTRRTQAASRLWTVLHSCLALRILNNHKMQWSWFEHDTTFNTKRFSWMPWSKSIPLLSRDDSINIQGLYCAPSFYSGLCFFGNCRTGVPVPLHRSQYALRQPCQQPLWGEDLIFVIKSRNSSKT